jgi:hypothetical protein
MPDWRYVTAFGIRFWNKKLRWTYSRASPPPEVGVRLMCGVIGNDRLLFTRMASLTVVDCLSEEILAWGSVIEPIDLDAGFLTGMQTALATTLGMKRSAGLSTDLLEILGRTSGELASGSVKFSSGVPLLAPPRSSVRIVRIPLRPRGLHANSITWQSPASLPQIKCGKTRTVPGFPQ